MREIPTGGFVPPKNTNEGSAWHEQQRKQASEHPPPRTCLTGDTRILVPGGWRPIIAEGCVTHSFSFLRSLRVVWGRWGRQPERIGRAGQAASTEVSTPIAIGSTR